MNWSDGRRNSWKIPLWCVTVSFHLRGIWSLMGLVLLNRSWQISQKCLAWWMRWGWEAGRQLRTPWEVVGAACANRRARQHWSSLDLCRSFDSFRNFPESLRLIPDLPCCFAFSPSSYLECYPKFCHAWLVGLGLTICKVWISRSVVWHCGPSYERGKGHLPSGCRGRFRPFLQRCHARVISARVSCGCCEWFGVPCCCFWWVACVGWHSRRVLGKWVQSQAGCVPNIRFVSPEAMTAKGIIFRLWTLSRWWKFLSRAWRGQSIATGCCHVLVFVVPLLQGSCRCRRSLSSSATTWECGLSSLSTLLRLGYGPTTTT